MRFIKTEENSNGGHCNQMGGLIVDDEWVKIPNDIITQEEHDNLISALNIAVGKE